MLSGADISDTVVYFHQKYQSLIPLEVFQSIHALDGENHAVITLGLCRRPFKALVM